MNRRRSAGVALITALLVVAISTSLAVGLAVRQNQAIQSTGGLLLTDQARELARSGLELALFALDEDDAKVDGPADAWAEGLSVLPLDVGTLSIQVTDLQGRLNLNNLIDPEGLIDPVARARLDRLLRALNLDPALADRIADWIDPDDQPSPGGAEDAFYAGRNPPHRAANRPLVSVSSLRLLEGLGDEEFAQLAPQVAALPRGTSLNLNTASDEVLRALGDGVKPSSPEVDAEERMPENHESVDAALQARGIDPASVTPQRLSVRSAYFLVDVRVELVQSRARLLAVVHRPGDAPATVIARTFESCLNDISCI
ncbi:MAG: type II secretion system minor pseudopilin GspK [Halothiobacillaceae bacterium]